MSGKECVSFKVMLVEDDEGFRRSLSGLLKSRLPSILLVEASDDAEAMEKVESFLPPNSSSWTSNCRGRTG